jgi:hypothetical protein
MLVYMFRSRRDTTLLALSIDKTGANLPEEHGPWESQGTPAMQVANGLGADARLEYIWCVSQHLDRTACYSRPHPGAFPFGAPGWITL